MDKTIFCMSSVKSHLSLFENEIDELHILVQTEATHSKGNYLTYLPTSHEEIN